MGESAASIVGGYVSALEALDIALRKLKWWTKRISGDYEKAGRQHGSVEGGCAGRACIFILADRGLADVLPAPIIEKDFCSLLLMLLLPNLVPSPPSGRTRCQARASSCNAGNRVYSGNDFLRRIRTPS